MKALYMEPYKAAEIIEVDDMEETLGGAVEHLWPFEDAEEICMVVLADREDMPPNRTFEECGMVRGPILFVGSHDDFDDLTDDEIAFVERRTSFAEEEYDSDDYDPFEEDAQEEEDFCGTRIVDEDEFYGSINGVFF
jgi:hypothetical protein